MSTTTQHPVTFGEARRDGVIVTPKVIVETDGSIHRVICQDCGTIAEGLARLLTRENGGEIQQDSAVFIASHHADEHSAAYREAHDGPSWSCAHMLAAGRSGLCAGCAA